MDAERADRVIASMPTRRTCAGCDLCCTAMGVGSIDKEPGVRCPHLLGLPGASCSIYKTRPSDCREFLCLWRGSDNQLPPELFPARCGFVVAMTSGISATGFSSFPILFTVHPDPKRPDAWMDHKPVFKKIAADFNAIVAVGQWHLARSVFSPKGNEFPRDQFPELYKDDGGEVGLPEAEFFTWRPTFASVCLALWG